MCSQMIPKLLQNFSYVVFNLQPSVCPIYYNPDIVMGYVRLVLELKLQSLTYDKQD